MSIKKLKQKSAHLLPLILILSTTGCAITSADYQPESSETTMALRTMSPPDRLKTAPLPVAPGEITPEPFIVETVWDAFRMNQAFVYEPDQSRIQQQLQRYLGEPNYIPLVMNRATPYLHYILETLQEQQLPSELAMLPVIESAYHSNARSRNGAGGLWQLMPFTARELGIKQDWLYDGRDDFIHSTAAALTYLKILNQRLDGDWLLTLAAYNAGYTTVSNAIRSNQSKGLATDYWSLSLPAETMAYVPRFLAVVNLINYPDFYAINLPDIPYSGGFEQVTINKAVSLKKLAKKSDIEPALFTKLNPAFKQGVTPARGEYTLLTPVTKADQVRQIIPALPVAKIYPQQHIVQRGETLSHLSRQYNVSIASLKQANQLASSRIRTGGRIIIPRNASSSMPNQENFHVVQQGETLWAIARRYQLTVTQLAELNAISTKTTLHPGTELIIREG